MKVLKKFENYMSREEMCNVLCRCGYTMSDLENCSNSELEEMCRNAEDNNVENNHNMSYDNVMTQESMGNMSRIEMCRVLCRCGYTMADLENCSNAELEEMCRTAYDNAEDQENMSYDNVATQENKKEEWIQDAIKKPGALRKSMNKKEDEKISKSEISDEISKLKAKDKDPDKKGVQGLSKSDLTKYRRLNLAKTLKGLKEHQTTENYMFFGNLKTIKRLVDEMLEMDESKIDEILSDGHGWALDHIATSKDDIEEVFNFLAGHETPHHPEDESIEPSHEETEGHLAHKDLESEMRGIKSFQDFKK